VTPDTLSVTTFPVVIVAVDIVEFVTTEFVAVMLEKAPVAVTVKFCPVMVVLVKVLMVPLVATRFDVVSFVTVRFVPLSAAVVKFVTKRFW